MNIVIGIATSVALLIILHWFPWPAKLHRLAAYTTGVAALLAGELVWLGLEGHWLVWAVLLAFAVIGGATVAGCYLIDFALRARAQRKAGYHDGE